MSTPARENWGSKLGFILAAAGSAIGLGNIWKFPYVVGDNGGAAFIIIYLICTVLVGLPVIIGEILIGRTSQRNAIGAFKVLSGSKLWAGVGGMGILASFLILSFYCVVAGWSLGYIYEAASGVFFDFAEPAVAGQHFESLVSNPVWILGCHFVFIIISMLIVYRGVQGGIEKGSKIMMPLLFLLLIILLFRGVTLDGAEQGLAFLFEPDWSKVTGDTILEALGQSFFTLSLGMGCMLTYGSYMTKKDSVPSAALNIIILDTLIAIVAGVVIFTAVFATGQDPTEGPGLIFHTLPIVFTKMTGGYFFSILFFILLTLAAVTSVISLLEVIVAYFVDEKKWERRKAVMIFGGIGFLMGIPSAMSFNMLADFKIFGLNFFDLTNYIASNILLPLGGLFVAVFIAWRWGLDKAFVNLKEGAETLLEKQIWIKSLISISLKYVAPVLIFLVFLNSIGFLNPILNLFE